LRVSGLELFAPRAVELGLLLFHTGKSWSCDFPATAENAGAACAIPPPAVVAPKIVNDGGKIRRVLFDPQSPPLRATDLFRVRKPSAQVTLSSLSQSLSETLFRTPGQRGGLTGRVDIPMFRRDKGAPILRNQRFGRSLTHWDFMNIVVVESPAKAKAINRYLGSGYEVLASFGHVRDLPAKDGSVDP